MKQILCGRDSQAHLLRGGQPSARMLVILVEPAASDIDQQNCANRALPHP
jgi:hypothetical protein